MTKVAELEDMVKKNSEYQKLLQNKIKEMQMIEKRKEEERLSRESELVERLRELEEQSKDQVGAFFLKCPAAPRSQRSHLFLG